jgi:hypothetical protein
MSAIALDLAVVLLRTTRCLTLAVFVVGLLLRWLKIASPRVHRICWALALVVGWSFMSWSLEVPW